MNFRHYKTCLARAGAMVAFAFAAAAAFGQDAAKQAKPVVYAGIGPAAWVARELACDRVEVRTLLPDGCDPHTFEPAARDIAKLAESQAYFSLDLPFEQRVKKILVTQKTGTGPVFSGSVPICELRETGSVPVCEDEESGPVPISSDGKKTGPVPAHDHDPHAWVTPEGMAEMAEAARAALDGIDPEGAEKRRAVFSSLKERLEAMDAEFAALFAPHAGKILVVHHPSWGHFAERYGLRMAAIEEEGREPSTRQLVRLVEQARACGATTVFAEPQFSRRASEAVAKQLGGKVVVVDPLSADWEANIRAVAAAFAEALADETPLAEEAAK